MNSEVSILAAQTFRKMVEAGFDSVEVIGAESELVSLADVHAIAQSEIKKFQRQYEMEEVDVVPISESLMGVPSNYYATPSAVPVVEPEVIVLKTKKHAYFYQYHPRTSQPMFTYDLRLAAQFESSDGQHIQACLEAEGHGTTTVKVPQKGEVK